MVYAKTKAMKLKESACNNAQHLVESTSHDGFISFNREIRTVRTLYIRKTKASFTAEPKKRRIHCVEQFTKFAHIASIQSGQEK